LPNEGILEKFKGPEWAGKDEEAKTKRKLARNALDYHKAAFYVICC